MSRKKFVSWVDEPAELIKCHKRSRDAHRSRNNERATYLTLYYDQPIVTGSNNGDGLIGFDGLRDLGFNVLNEVVRGGKSQIVQPLQPRLAPVGGDWEQLQACEGLSQVIDGVFDACGFVDIAASCVVDGALCGEGFAVVDVDPITKDFYADRLNPLDTFFNSDRTIASTCRIFDRRKLRAWFGEQNTKDGVSLKAVIDDLPCYEPDRIIGVDASSQWDDQDIVAVYFGWAQPIGTEPGKFVIQLDDEGQTIVDQGEWKYPVPITSFEWDQGFRGANDSRPMARSVAPMHYWLNEMVRKMYDALRGTKPIVTGSKDPKLSDVPYEFIEDRDGTMKVWTPTTVSQDVRNQVTDLREQSHREVGLSEESAAGAAPPQFKSGVALSTWRQVVNTAISGQLRAYDGLWNGGSRIILARAPDVYKSKKARAAARGSEIIDQIDFASLKMPENQPIVSMDVVSDLPKHIPQKLELLDYLETKGWIDGPTALVNLNIVDFRAVAKRAAGPRALIETQIVRAAKEGILIAPSEVQDPAKVAELAGEAYQSYLAQKVQPPAIHMQALLHLYLLAKARLQAPPAAPQLGAVAPPPTPGPPVPDLGQGEPSLPVETGAAAPQVPPAEPLPT